MKTQHLVDQDGNHHVAIDGLRVWLFRDGQHWVAHGIDIDYAVPASNPEAAKRAFAAGLCMTLVENLRRFGSVDRVLSRPAPSEIQQRWLHALKAERILPDAVDFRVPDDELRGLPRPAGLPQSVRYYQSGAHQKTPRVRLPSGPSDGSLPRDLLVARLRKQGITIEGPEQLRLLSSDQAVLVQPLTATVPRDVIRSIARTFDIPIERLYFDTYESG